MGSLMKLFEGQMKVLSLGKMVSGFVSHNQRNIATETNNEAMKRPPSSFLLFLHSKQLALRKQFPDLKYTQIVKLASSMWKTESAATKQYHQNEYDRMMEEYRLSNKELPRGPSAPFAQFFSEKSSSLQYQYPNIQERLRRASELWKNLSIVEKQRYTSTYINQRNTFMNNLSEQDRLLIQQRKDVQNLKQQQRDIRRYGKEGLKERPNPPIRNPYSIFMKEQTGMHHGQNTMKNIAEQWNNLSASEKMAYKEKVNDAVKNYEQDLAEWQKKYDRSPQK